MSNKQISILGCGWLGFPLAQKLLENGFLVNGTTTSAEKINHLETAKIQSFLISLSENEIAGDVSSFLENSEVLIINIPPKVRSVDAENFFTKIEKLLSFIEQSTIKKVLFVSSTSVYGDVALNDLRFDKLSMTNQKNTIVVTEETPTNPDTKSGKQLLATENLLQSNSNFTTTILRFGGLIGEDRHPIKQLAGKENLENPEAPINLIHQKDCIAIILKIIQNNVWGEIFNAVAPFHPSRMEFYTKKAIERSLALPKFTTATTNKGKIISSDKIISLLHHQFELDL